MTYDEFMNLFEQIKRNGKYYPDELKWVISDEEWCKTEGSGLLTMLTVQHNGKIYKCDRHGDIYGEDAPTKYSVGRWEQLRHRNGQVSLMCPKCGYTVNNWTTVYYNYCHCCGMDMNINRARWWKLE